MSGKLLIAIFASLLIHAILVFNLTLFNNADVYTENFEGELTASNLNVPVLQVGFLVLPKPKDLPLEKKPSSIELIKNSDKIYAIIENNHKFQTKPQELDSGLSLTELDKNTSSTKFPQQQYFKPSEVDIRAIPVHGIEPPIPTTVNKLLVVYKVRVFINKNGFVDQVVNLNEDDPEQIFYTNIEEQIKKLTFIPAKKNSTEVDSYIDIALEL
jgi:hypothetical protein